MLAAAFLWLANPNGTSLEWGLPVSLLGLGLRAWAAGHLEKDSALARSGPYTHVRNPLYAGTLTVAAGFAIASRRWELGVLFAAVFFLIYLPVVELEEQHLRSLFPEYGAYADRVPRLIPRLATAMESAQRFRWALYLKNREYEALVGFLAGVALLVWKALFQPRP